MTPQKALQLLQSEIVQVVGCTEPAAIAYAFRTLVRHLPEHPDPASLRAVLRISKDAFRNASTAVVPVIRQPGILAAAAAGLASRVDDFNVFSDFDLKRAREFLKHPHWLQVVPVSRRGLFVELQFSGLRTGILLQGRHNHIEKLVVQGKDCTPREAPLPPPPTLDEIFDLVQARHPKLEALARDFILRQVPAEKGHPLKEQIARRISGRMAGYSHPVMTLTGSGNQGIFIGLPYRQFYEQHGDDILPALLFSLLAQIHLSAKHNRLSSQCGLATKAAPALAAGLAFGNGASRADIRRLFRDIPARLSDMTCEGAEPACGDKARRAFCAIRNGF